MSSTEPDVTHPGDAKAASDGGFSSKIITTPNQDWIPEHPIERTVIKTYANGLWGYHEYSRWPQPLTPNMYHVAFIPRPRSVEILPAIVWLSLSPESDWEPAPGAGMRGVGFLKPSIRDELSIAAATVISRYDMLVGGPDHLRAYGQELRVVLKHCVSSVHRLPTPAGVAIALGAHVQRLSLELAGICTYLREVLPRMQSGSDHSRLILPVLGAFVHDETTALRCAKAGLPTWLLQPLTLKIRVWRVVAMERPSYLCTQTSDPPLEYMPDEVAGVVNTSTSWLSRMVFAVSRELCSATLPTLSDARGMTSKVIALPEAPPPTKAERSAGYKRVRRGGKKTKNEVPDGGSVTHPGRESSAHPSREHIESPFYRLPEVWRTTLQEVGSLPQPRESVLYFYPPPFLLDTVSSDAQVPTLLYACVPRLDAKVDQYLHNLVRIRAFCRRRLLDPTMSAKPLTIGEWRTVLWGEYRAPGDVPVARTAANQHRATKKHNIKVAVARMCANSAALPSYDPGAAPVLAGLAVRREDATQNWLVRLCLCWEAHEINFRCELMALDALMVPRDNWPIMHRWAREARVSEVWGPPASLLTVIPDVPSEITRPWWVNSYRPHWKSGEERLRAFVGVMSTWKDFPEELLGKLEKVSWDNMEYDQVQREAARFYVRTFISRYHRLPIVPIDYPTDEVIGMDHVADA
ncbi:hypothetical protein K466DRAFT_491098 [Polyporus arcularius HHB13444]|uniref:Uncharacterized protein n=1 Tax=Polyporus arcularius HHB13444 TaxID=1314778 RepID=A0A5C3PMU4_9APHY|nr:hypothetical protein K466DRAFT_491098 [Polyporus arcularius HHB13444]